MDAEPDLETRYDQIAAGYARHWGPVIRPAAEGVLDHLPVSDGEASRLLDVGTGTGVLAIAALERWPALTVTGIDPSRGMLALAEESAARRLGVRVARRFSTAAASADELPFPDATFDLAVSSFVLQLVPDRAAALREARRVLRPGGTFAWVAWQVGGEPFEADRVANEVLDEFGFDPPEPESRPGDLASPAAAALGMRRAGFRDVRALAGEVAHRWDAANYLAFLTEFDEETLFAELDDEERARIVERLRARLAPLSAEELTLRLPVVYVRGRVPA